MLVLANNQNRRGLSKHLLVKSKSWSFVSLEVWEFPRSQILSLIMRIRHSLTASCPEFKPDYWGCTKTFDTFKLILKMKQWGTMDECHIKEERCSTSSPRINVGDCDTFFLTAYKHVTYSEHFHILRHIVEYLRFHDQVESFLFIITITCLSTLIRRCGDLKIAHSSRTETHVLHQYTFCHHTSYVSFWLRRS